MWLRNDNVFYMTLLSAALPILTAELNGVRAGREIDNGCLHIVPAQAPAWHRENLLLSEPEHAIFDGKGDCNIVDAAVVRRVPVEHMKRTRSDSEFDLVLATQGVSINWREIGAW